MGELARLVASAMGGLVNRIESGREEDETSCRAYVCDACFHLGENSSSPMEVEDVGDADANLLPLWYRQHHCSPKAACAGVALDLALKSLFFTHPLHLKTPF